MRSSENRRMSKPFAVALVGCGEIGSMRAAAIAKSARLRLRAVCDIDRERAEALSKRFGGAVYRDAEGAVRAPEVDLVIISTSNNLHAPLAIAAMNAGKHVLCEKPLARNLEEATAMLEAAVRNGVQLKTGFNHRYYPCVSKSAELVREGAVGRPILLRASIGHPGGPDFFKRWFADPRIAGGGTLIDNGVHMLDITRWILGEVDEVMGMSSSARVSAGLDDNCFALLRAGRAIASISSSWNKWDGYFEIEITGDEGYIHCRYPPMEVRVGKINPRNGRLSQKRVLFLRDVLLEKVLTYRHTTIGTFLCEFNEWLEAVEANRPPAFGAKDGYRVTELVQAIYRSAREGVRVPTPVTEVFKTPSAPGGRS